MKKRLHFLLYFFVLVLLLFSGCTNFYPPRNNTFDDNLEDTIALAGIYNAYENKEYDTVVSLVSTYFQHHNVTQDNFYILHYRAISFQHLGENESAIDDYETMVPHIRNISNIQQRDYVMIFFTLGELYSKQQNADKAISYYQYGLQINPQYNPYHIQFGQIYENLGRTDEALQLYQHIKDTFVLNEEEEVLVQMRIDRLTQTQPAFTFAIPDSYYPYYPIKFIPLNDFNNTVNLQELCTMLTSKYRVACEILAPMTIPEEEILNKTANQYDAKKIIQYLDEHVNESVKHGTVVIGITNQDMYTDELKFVFSRQDFDRDIGVISTYMFQITLLDMPETEQLLGRRIGIQCLSTVGQLLGYERTTDPICPLSSTNSINEFLMKNSVLCSETQTEVDSRMQNRTQWLVLYTTEQKAEIQRVYQYYYYE